MDRLLTPGGALVFFFLYLPILVVVIYAFNGSRVVASCRGFSLRCWGEAWRDGSIREAFFLSGWTAGSNAVVAVVLGTAAAIGLRNVGKRTRTAFDAFMYMARSSRRS